jgi:putative transposase
MTRPLRFHVPGGFYHVTLRGNHRQDIFRTSADRELLDDIVEHAVHELGTRVHAYCWMTNHIHLLVQVSDAPLGRFILRIASRYARKYQEQMATTGHLFERRYHAVLVDADSYLLTLVRYIHLNPVRAGLTHDPSAFPWSSHLQYLGRRRASWIHTDFVLNMLGSDPRKAVPRYLEWMNAADGTRWGEGILATNPANPQILGDDAFLKRMSAKAACGQAKVSMNELLAECCRRFNVAPEAIKSKSRSRHLSAARAWLSHNALTNSVATTTSIARELGRSEAAIRGLMIRHPLRPAE